jgi:iron(III) transport system substrate-binding protein
MTFPGAVLARLMAAILLTAGSAHAAYAQSFAELASGDSATRHQRLVEAAKKEGSINLYTSIPEKDMSVPSAGFEKLNRLKN